ncbi:unnamed protein product [Periconia digitata]|uniref:Uncharacterized protein n=1 Tax=Periconia digitata TaxID=1303443 RepID=A0A9W4XQQ5_9PLEO|nr:unnamed protein product [Periconia digitata]
MDGWPPAGHSEANHCDGLEHNGERGTSDDVRKQADSMLWNLLTSLSCAPTRRFNKQPSPPMISDSSSAAGCTYSTSPAPRTVFRNYSSLADLYDSKPWDTQKKTPMG